MGKVYTYKLQGDGRDSWKCEEIENGEVINSYMVYEDPNKPQLSIDEILAQIQLLQSELQKLKGL